MSPVHSGHTGAHLEKIDVFKLSNHSDYLKVYKKSDQTKKNYVSSLYIHKIMIVRSLVKMVKVVNRQYHFF